MKNTISILGCGWLGLPLSQSFLKKGISVNGSTTSVEKIKLLKAAGIEPFLINIESFKSNIDDFLKAEILIISITSKNIDAFKNLLLKIENSPVQNVIFISSTSVYGSADGIVTEEFPVSGALAEIEDLFKNSPFLKTTVLRFGGLFGGERQPAIFLKNRVVPEPDAPVNFIHREDCIGIIQHVIEKNVWGETFNCCADTHPSKREFYTKAALDSGIAPPTFSVNSAGIFKIISNEKVKKFLEYKFRYNDLMDLANDA